MLRDDPCSGTGKPEPLKHNLSGLWSRRISQKDRVIYKHDNEYIYIFAKGATTTSFDSPNGRCASERAPCQGLKGLLSTSGSEWTSPSLTDSLFSPGIFIHINRYTVFRIESYLLKAVAKKINVIGRYRPRLTINAYGKLPSETRLIWLSCYVASIQKHSTNWT